MSDPRHSNVPGTNSRPESAAGQSRIGRLEATVHGRVQGVGFRWFASRTASRLELNGWVSNRPDGSVLVVAEGPETALDGLLAALQRGPAGAQVERVDIRRADATGGLMGFEIKSGSHSGD